MEKNHDQDFCTVGPKNRKILLMRLLSIKNTVKVTEGKGEIVW